MNHSPRGEHEPCGNTAARLCARGLIVRYRNKSVLDIPSLTLGSGITALTGANGAGKSTLLKVFALLVPPTAGQIALGDDDVTPRSAGAAYRKSVGYLPQNADFPGHFTVEEAVTYSAWLRGIKSRNRREAVQTLIERLDLGSQAGTRLKFLSGGNRQRAYIAQAIVHDPAVLLLDEPTTGIDVEHRIELRELLSRVGRDRCVVMSTHHTEDIELLSHRVVSLREGRVVFDGTPADLIGQVEGAAQNAAEPTPEARAIEIALRRMGGTA
ncbi:ATP-binding cassette domain-containing protein [Streptomyces longhuiensis]|uniref:ATP-binding cassette domain-containing protein n=1 Tax=Streptomyces longhuiensis TaxID=2880933 RepID=UPI001D0AFBFB|nr:ATP-binding cassette domain-containing protein [Streptomyces longhuiensis]UDM05453.1 ATP-binding cassette domain-containing protein [Streptomyces longhuiensis]